MIVSFEADAILLLVNEQDGDIIVQSSDEILFILRLSQIAAHAGAFPLQVCHYVNGLPALVVPEPARVLEVVLHFLYPTRPSPALEHADFNLLMSVAQTVEKYQVFAAMRLCVRRLRYVRWDCQSLDVAHGFIRHFVREYPALITFYATKYNHPSLIKEAALHLLFSPLYETAEQLSSSDVLPWVI